MKDVRERGEIEHALFWSIERAFGWIGDRQIEQIAAHIAERFDVTPKPVVTDDDLGGLMRAAFVNASDVSRLAAYINATERAGLDVLGMKFRDQLDAAGLRLVRVEEGEG